MMPQYRLTPGFILRGGKKHVQRVGEAMEALADKSTSGIIRAARNKSSPLHPHITWDAKRALVKCQRAEAAYLRCAIQYVFTNRDGSTTPVRLCQTVELHPRSEAVFMDIRDILKDPALRARHLGNALLEADAWRARYETLSELTAVFEALDRAKKRSAKRKTA